MKLTCFCRAKTAERPDTDWWDEIIERDIAAAVEQVSLRVNGQLLAGARPAKQVARHKKQHWRKPFRVRRTWL